MREFYDSGIGQIIAVGVAVVLVISVITSCNVQKGQMRTELMKQCLEKHDLIVECIPILETDAFGNTSEYPNRN